MASGFSGNQKGTCEGPGCQSASSLEYYLKEKKNLCEDCATKAGNARKMKTDELGMFCEKHDKPIKLYCEDHELAVCQICAIKDHQKPCQLEDVHVALTYKRAKLLNLRVALHEKQLVWKGFDNQVSECRQGTEMHMKSTEREVKYKLHIDLVRSREKETHAAEQINDEADEEIRKITEEINKKREARLKQCHEEAENHRKPIEIRRRELLDDVTSITRTTETKIDELQRDTRDVMQCLDDAADRVKILLEDDKELLNCAQKLITSITDTLRKTVDDELVECITQTVRGVQFIEGVGNEKYNGRIGGYGGKWELGSTVKIPSVIKCPFIPRCTSKDDIILTDFHGNENHTYCFNIKNKSCDRVIKSEGKAFIVSCALLDEGTIVCGKCIGKCTGDSLPGCISVYNRQWELIRDITLPRNTTLDDTWVFAVVAQDGMIIAAESHQNCLYVINPNDGSIVNTIRCKEKVGVMSGVLATGEVIVLPIPPSNKLLIIDREGALREITHTEIENAVIDPLTHDLYMVSFDGGCTTATINQLAEEDDRESREVFSYPLRKQAHSFGIYVYNIPVITASGDMIVCKGRECLVFKKRFTL